MRFDPYNYSLKIQESIETLIPKVGAHLGVFQKILEANFEREKNVEQRKSDCK